MFERFTHGARQVVVLAREEACALKHDYLGTEHILLGVIREEEGVGARVLDLLGITIIERTRAQVVQIVGEGEEASPDQLPFTLRGKKVLGLGIQEADALDDAWVASHHLLLGLLREGEGLAGSILLDSGVDGGHLRDLVLAGLDHTPEEQMAVDSEPQFVVLGRPGDDPGGAVARDLAAAVCSFCGQRGPYMFSSGASEPNDAWICGGCLDLFQGSRGRRPSPPDSGPNADSST